MGRRKGKSLKELAKKLYEKYGESMITTREAMKALDYTSYPSFYTYILKKMIEKKYIEKPFRGIIKIKKIK